MTKSRDAFRTISEVSAVLDTPAHVLRFWESKFNQVKPVKRAGGRRYYRPGDVDLLAGIKQLLHDDGMTIKGAQKLLREQGVKHVSGIGAVILEAEDTETQQEAIDAREVSVEHAPAVQHDAFVNRDDSSRDPLASDSTLDITNVVALQKTTPKPHAEPDVSLDQVTGPTTPEGTDVSIAPETPPAPRIDVPADPSDSDSKASARIFHLLHKTPPHRLARHADAIAPLLMRMRVLRDQVASH